MADEMRIARVLLAQPGLMAARLAAFFRERSIEVVVAFGEADAEAWWVEAGDYDAYVPGDVDADVSRLIAAAMDAGCDAIHPGSGPLCESVDLYHIANNANLAVLSGEPSLVQHAMDRTFQRGNAERLRLPVLPGTRALPEGSDGLDAIGGWVGAMRVRSTWGRSLALVGDASQLPDAVRAARAAGEPLFVHAEPRAGKRRAESWFTVVASDRSGGARAYGVARVVIDGAGREPGLVRVVALRDAEAADRALEEASAALVKALRWVGVCAVRWVHVDGQTWFEEVTLGLPPGFEAVESAFGIDLVALSHDLLEGGALPRAVDLDADRYAWHAAVHPASDGATEESLVERIEAPEGVAVAAEVGAPCVPGRAIAWLTGVAGTDADARARLGRALDQLHIEGPDTNLGALRAAVAAPG